MFVVNLSCLFADIPNHVVRVLDSAYKALHSTRYVTLPTLRPIMTLCATNAM